MKNRKRNLIIIISFSIIIGFVLLISTISGAKYYSEKYYPTTVSSDKFYFTVDLLGNTNLPSDLNKTYHLYGGDAKNIKFNVVNYFDDLRITSSDITFDVALSGSAKDLSSVVVEKTTLSKDNKDESLVALNILEGYKNLDEVVVTITSNAPFKKVFNITFVLHSYNEIVECKINDNDKSLYAEVVVSANILIDEYSLIIDYSDINDSANMLQADMNNSYLKDGKNTNIPTGDYLTSVTITKVINAGESITINMYKKVTSLDYSTLDITLTSEEVAGKLIYKVYLKEKVGD